MFPIFCHFVLFNQSCTNVHLNLSDIIYLIGKRSSTHDPVVFLLLERRFCTKKVTIDEMRWLISTMSLILQRSQFLKTWTES